MIERRRTAPLLGGFMFALVHAAGCGGSDGRGDPSGASSGTGAGGSSPSGSGGSSSSSASGGGGSSSSSSASGSGGSSSSSSTSGSGGGGAGGSGGASSASSGGGGAGGSAVCVPGQGQNCYTGPAGTLGVGVCAEGFAICLPDGSGYGPCVGDVTPTPEDCSTPEDEDCDGQATPCTGAHVWSKSAGSKLGSQYGDGIAADPAGNVLVVGFFGGSVDFGGGALTDQGYGDLFVAKLDPAGGHVWSKRFGEASAAQSAEAVAADGAGNVVIGGNFAVSLDLGGGAMTTASSGDFNAFVAKLDAAGNHLWSKSFGDTKYQFVSSIVVDAAGAILVAGGFSGTIDFGGGPLPQMGGNENGFLVKLDAAGNHVWSKAFPTTASTSIAYDVAVDGAGNMLVIGMLDGATNLGGGTIAAGGGGDAYVAKFDPNGAHLWSKAFGDGGYQVGRSVATTPAGEVIVVGGNQSIVNLGGGPLTSASGLGDVFVAKLDAAGNHVWSKGFGDASSQWPEDVAVDPAGNIVLMGYFDGAPDFGGGPLSSLGTDVFVAKLDAAGNHVWSKGFGDKYKQYPKRVAIDAAGSALLTGYFEGTLDFGGATLVNPINASQYDVYDLFVAKLAP